MLCTRSIIFSNLPIFFLLPFVQSRCLAFFFFFGLAAKFEKTRRQPLAAHTGSGAAAMYIKEIIIDGFKSYAHRTTGTCAQPPLPPAPLPFGVFGFFAAFFCCKKWQLFFRAGRKGGANGRKGRYGVQMPACGLQTVLFLLSTRPRAPERHKKQK